MRKIIISGIIIYCLLFTFFLKVDLNSQTKNLTISQNKLPGQFIINGSVRYMQDFPGNVVQMQVDINVSLGKTSSYKIIKVRFNGKDVPHKAGQRYYKTFRHYKIKNGQTLKIEVGIVKTLNINIRQSPIFYSLAKFQVENYIKRYIYPTHNQVISLNSMVFAYLPFKWQFSKFTEKSSLTIVEYNGNGNLLSVETNKNTYRVPKNILKPNKKYYIAQHSKINREFKLTKEVRANSKITFHSSCYLDFKTR